MHQASTFVLFLATGACFGNPLEQVVVSALKSANVKLNVDENKGDYLAEVTKVVVGNLGSNVLIKLSELDVDDMLKKAGIPPTQGQSPRCAEAFECGSDKRCLAFTRALNGQTGFGVRTPINQNSPFLDLSTVYGSSACVAASVRSFVDGQLKTFNLNGEILPPQNKNDTACRSKAPEYCFLAGDSRSKQQPGLVSRRVNIAQFQHHVFNEYLPLVIGQQLVNAFHLTPLKTGYYTGYSSSVNAATSAEFSAAAFRFGHGLVRKDFPRLTNSNGTAGVTIELKGNMNTADFHYTPNQGGEASFIEGMLQCPVMKADNEFSFPIRNQLFEQRGVPASGTDLVSINNMRGRDMGLFPYNEYRTLVGLKRATTFDDLKSEMDPANVEALKNVYADVNDIDLYSGIILEKPTPGAMVGPTGGYIIAEQFSAFKRGDRFFYENKASSTQGLSKDELQAIRDSRLAKVFCTNNDDMKNVNLDVFALTTDRVPCSSIPVLDIKPFLG
ncbi:unnamed protein product [Nippostrongylus brasiliensis]|uniref:Chorion peroxidase (inferred by orthology to a D. melanogaster protein) n=1 Tax=Nippostrongylus brasiliensis TaxID=27835 RepID=A0A0N4YB91_NIPBR|nr:unnamed protein product [Nippostrongylus brasiliensis]